MLKITVKSEQVTCHKKTVLKHSKIFKKLCLSIVSELELRVRDS